MTHTPPKEFLPWLDYAIATMDVRGAYLGRVLDGAGTLSQEDVRLAAMEELNHLRLRASMPWVGMLDNWRTALSKRLGRAEEVILEDRLLESDFSDAGVHIQFKDGSDLTFRRAFFLGGGETPTDGSYLSHRVAVFTEHCGYHEFWIGPGDRIEAIEREADLQFANEVQQSQAEAAQGLVVPYQFGAVGREFGSPDYERLTAEDAVKFASDLQAWAKISQEDIDSDDVAHALKEYPTDARNIQIALQHLGQDVSIEVAAAVWIHYSNSQCAGWMADASSAESAARTLYLNCPSQK